VVEGAHLGTARDDPSNYRVQITQHVRCGNTHDAKSIAPKQCIPSRVTAWLIASAVRLPVDFDNQPTLQARKVDSHPVGRKLATELKSGGSLAQRLPQ
jgi:hypothetical protein